jgi:hypothetical protein
MDCYNELNTKGAMNMAEPDRHVQEGIVFIGSTAAAGVVIPAYNSTSPTFGIWNPTGSGVEAVLLHVKLGLVTVGTAAMAAMGLTWLANAGDKIATGSAISAFTDGTPINTRLGYGKKSQVRFTPSGATLGAAPVHLSSIGQTSGTTGLGANWQWIREDFDGHPSVPPGNFLGIGGSVAPGLTMQITLCWMEIPFIS